MDQFALNILNEAPIYPGHPLTTALVIMHRYPALEDAARQTGLGFPQALGEGDIPGAGGMVYTALDMLKLIADGELSIDQADLYARERWGDAGGHHKAIEPGQLQADRLWPSFVAKAKEWFV